MNSTVRLGWGPLWAGGRELPLKGHSSLSKHLMHHPRHAPCSQLNQVSEDVRAMAWLALVVEKWGAKAAPSVCGQTAPPPSPKASHSRQHISTLPSNHASIWCFLNYILSCAHDARCVMCLLQAIAELQLYCAAPYTHPKCKGDAPTKGGMVEGAHPLLGVTT